MSAPTVTKPVPTPPAETPKKDEPKVEVFDPKSLSGVSKTVFDTAQQAAESYNTLTGKIDAATGDVEKAKAALSVTIPESVPTELKSAYDALSELAEKFTTAVSKYFEAQKSNISAEDLEKLEAERGTSKKLYDECKTFLKGIAPMSLSALTVLAGKKKSTTAGSAQGRGAGGMKIRNVNVYVQDPESKKYVLATLKDKDGKEKSTITAAAKVLGVTPTAIQGIYLSAAKTSDPKTAPEVVEFSVKVNENTERMVKVQRILSETPVATPEIPAVS